MDEFETYIAEPVAPARRGRKESGLALYLGFAVLLAAASLVAVNSRGGTPSKFPRVLVPGSSAACTSPPNGFLFSQFVDGTQMNVCISQQGNINQINYPDTAAGHTQIAWDGYCLHDSPAHTDYTDFSPGSGVASAGWGAATLTQTASNTFNMTRNVDRQQVPVDRVHQGQLPASLDLRRHDGQERRPCERDALHLRHAQRRPGDRRLRRRRPVQRVRRHYRRRWLRSHRAGVSESRAGHELAVVRSDAGLWVRGVSDRRSVPVGQWLFHLQLRSSWPRLGG